MGGSQAETVRANSEGIQRFTGIVSEPHIFDRGAALDFIGLRYKGRIGRVSIPPCLDHGSADVTVERQRTRGLTNGGGVGRGAMSRRGRIPQVIDARTNTVVTITWKTGSRAALAALERVVCATG